jgi:hypothetical protein
MSAAGRWFAPSGAQATSISACQLPVGWVSLWPWGDNIHAIASLAKRVLPVKALLRC